MKKREWILLAVYAVLLLVLAGHHEMWRDEVRAFSVATAAPGWGSLLTEIKHEGHPALWYALLRATFALTHSMLVLPVLAISIAIATAWLILAYAPFPLWLRAMVIFGAFLGYEISVVARNYGFGVLFIVVSCIAFRKRNERPLWLGVSLALLANTSIHATIAACFLLFYWGLDLFDAGRRASIKKNPLVIAAVGIAIAGIVIGVVTARPSADMAFAGRLEGLGLGSSLRAILVDPGLGLLGFHDASIAAAAELPWRLLDIPGGLAARVIVDFVLLWFAIYARRSGKALVTVALAIIVFEVLFQRVYQPSQRHESMLFFLIFGICWLDVIDKPREMQTMTSRRLARALLPLFAVQSAALVILVHRVWKYPESNSKAYGQFIRSQPRYADAILAGEPDYYMEPMPYYVRNRIYMPRQREFSTFAIFDRGQRRQLDLTIAELGARVDSLACSENKTVLLALGKPMTTGRPGEAAVAYYAHFRWTDADRDAVLGRMRRVAVFPFAVTDESYTIYEVLPDAACRRVR